MNETKSKFGLTQLAQLAEVVAAVAVVVSLIYVGNELRTNTAAVESASIQTQTQIQGELLLLLASDSTLSRIRAMGGDDPAQLTGVDAQRFFYLMRQTWINLQSVYFQHELGVMDDRIWEVYQRTICAIWSSPGIRQNWSGHDNTLDPDFVRLVESCEVG